MGQPGAHGGMSEQEQQMIKMVCGPILHSFLVHHSNFNPQMQTGMESCPAKVVMSGGAGFVLGGAMGLFLSSVSIP